MKKFLFITYYFPPAGGPSVQRIIRIIQHLAKSGWHCVVLTVNEGDYTTVDPQLIERVPANTQVIRTDFFEPYKLYRKFTGKKKEEKIPLAVLSSHSKASWKEKIANTIRMNLFIPDGRIGWYRQGVKAGIKAIKNDPDIKLVLSSGPPHTVHLIANTIARKTGLPFVADFRDPWINIDYYSDIKRNPLTVAFDRYLEGKVLSKANAITTVSPGYLKQLVSGHKNIDHNKAHIIYNGFDAEVYPKVRPEPPKEKFILTYIGNLPFNRYTPMLYQVIAQLKQDNLIQSNNFELRFYGNVDQNIRDDLEKFNISDFLHFHNFVPHQQAIIEICQSHMLLLIINDTRTRNDIIPGKLFEYLGSKRKIICIGPEQGETAKIISETNSGVTYDYKNVHDLKRYLTKQTQSWQKGKWQPSDSTQTEKYNGYEQLKQLNKIFENLLSKH
ncbi:glycosyltransferase [candidate division KSB1 bacterium]|nr:glycosyltransferase [candidate division KSB1 bacterium]